MKIKTRIVSVIMIMLMVISCTPFSSYAATSSKGTVYVDVTQDYANAQKVLTLVNKQRAKKGLRKLKLDKSLTNAAVQRAAEISMVIPTTSPHKRPDGRAAKTVHKLATRENCAEGYFGGKPSGVVSTWMHSKAHKATILLKSAKSAGIAYVTNPADPDTGYYVLIVSNSKAKKAEKSKKTISSTKKVVALSKYLKKKYFFQKVSRNSKTLYPGDTSTIRTYYFGTKTLDFTSPEINPKSFTWSSSNTGVAKVNSKGVVTAVGPGTVTIKAKLKKGPSIVLSTKYTVNGSEKAFDKLTKYMSSDGIWFGEFGYIEGNSYVFGYDGANIISTTTDPETGEEKEIRRENRAEYLVVPESRIGEEIAFMARSAYYDHEEFNGEQRTFMIVTKSGDKLDNTLTLIHDYLDEDGNCIFKLTSSCARGKVYLDELQWTVVKETPGVEIDYEKIESQISDIFGYFSNMYLHYYTGVNLKNLGIEEG